MNVSYVVMFVCIHVYECMYVRARACVCVCVCVYTYRVYMYDRHCLSMHPTCMYVLMFICTDMYEDVYVYLNISLHYSQCTRLLH